MSWFPPLPEVYSHLSKWLDNPLRKEWGYNHSYKDLSVGQQYNLVINGQLHSLCINCFCYSLQLRESATRIPLTSIFSQWIGIGLSHCATCCLCFVYHSEQIAPSQPDGEWSHLRTPSYRVCSYISHGFNYVSLGHLGNRCQGGIRRTRG